ncbi:MAG: AbrB/MazE/SpoVT family DNA-binding domain-containing protein [Chloroflexota bacterium]
MIARIQRWGNSQGIRFSKTFLKEAKVDVGDEVSVTIQDGKIIVEPVKRIHGKYDIRDLVAQIPQDYEAEEVDWGEPVGKEAW